MKERIDDRRPKHDFLVHFSFLTSCLIKQTHSRTQRPTVASSNSACCSHLKKKSTFKTTSSCTNMESYSHPGIYQQMNERKTGNLHFLSFFFQWYIFHPSVKRQKSHHAETSISPNVHGWLFFPPPVRLSRVQSGSCSLPDYRPPVGLGCAFPQEGRMRRSRQVAHTEPGHASHNTTGTQTINATSPALFAPGCH